MSARMPSTPVRNSKSREMGLRAGKETERMFCPYSSKTRASGRTARADYPSFLEVRAGPSITWNQAPHWLKDRAGLRPSTPSPVRAQASREQKSALVNRPHGRLPVFPRGPYGLKYELKINPRPKEPRGRLPVFPRGPYGTIHYLGSQYAPARRPRKHLEYGSAYVESHEKSSQTQWYCSEG